MSPAHRDLLAVAGAAAYTGAVLARMRRDEEATDELRAGTIALMYGAYALDVGLVLRDAAPRLVTDPPGRVRAGLGAGLLLAGAGVALAGARHFESLIQLSGGAPGSLRTGGIYRHTRNPQYVGIVAMLLGATTATRSPVAAGVTALAAGALDFWARVEQPHLERVFGAPYRAYAARVPRWVGRPQR